MTDLPQAAIDAGAVILTRALGNAGNVTPEDRAMARLVLVAAAPHLAAAERERLAGVAATQQGGHVITDPTLRACARCPESATVHLRVAARPTLLVKPGRILLDEHVCGSHTGDAARQAKDAHGTSPEGALSADEVRTRILAAVGSVHIGDVDPEDGYLYPGDRERIAEAVLAELGMGEDAS